MVGDVFTVVEKGDLLAIIKIGKTVKFAIIIILIIVVNLGSVKN